MINSNDIEVLCNSLPHFVLMAGLANVLSRTDTGSKALEQGCT